MFNILYNSFSKDMSHPADRRRFYGYAKARNLKINDNKNINKNDIIILTNGKYSDISIYNKIDNPKFKIVYDLCDGYLFEKNSIQKLLRGVYNYITKKNNHLHFAHTKLIKSICRKSDLIICASEMQKKEILKYCSNVHVISDIFGDEVYKNKNEFKRGHVFNIFWEGQGNNIIEFDDFNKIFNEIEKVIPIAIHFVTDLNYQNAIKLKRVTKSYIDSKFKNIQTNIYEWNNANLNEIAIKCDIAIIPSSRRHSNMFLNKSPNKLHLMWKFGLPTLTSFSHSYKEAMDAVQLDMICYKKQDWIDKIIYYYNNDKMREVDGKKSYNYVTKYHSDIAEIHKWDKAFMTLNFDLKNQ